MAKRTVGSRTVGQKPGLAVHRGIEIRKTPFGRWETKQLKWGDQPGEFYSFPTKKAAVAFIDRRIREKDLRRLMGIKIGREWGANNG